MPVAKEQIRQIISENNLNSVTDVYALLRDSFKDILQELMEAELDAVLGYEKNHKGDSHTDNKRNGHSPKNLKSQYGEFQIDVPRDRKGEFEPKLIPKYQRDISGIEEKVISLYARGMSTRDIHDQLGDLYGIELSAEMVSKITDKILPQVKEWQSFDSPKNKKPTKSSYISNSYQKSLTFIDTRFFTASLNVQQRHRFPRYGGQPALPSQACSHCCMQYNLL